MDASISRARIRELVDAEKVFKEGKRLFLSQILQVPQKPEKPAKTAALINGRASPVHDDDDDVNAGGKAQGGKFLGFWGVLEAPLCGAIR